MTACFLALVLLVRAATSEAANPALHERARAEADRSYGQARSESHHALVSDLGSSDPGTRREAAAFLLALLEIVDADATVPTAEQYAAGKKRSDNFQKARDLRTKIAEALSRVQHREESVPVARHFFAYEFDERSDRWRSLAIGMLRGFDAAAIVPLLQELLDPPHPDAVVVLAALDEIRDRKLKKLSGAVAAIAQHYRSDVRERAAAAAAALGGPALERFDPVKAVRRLDADLRNFVVMVDVEIPAGAPWMSFSLPPGNTLLEGIMREGSSGEPVVREISGWLIGETATEYKILDSVGVERSLPKEGTFAMASSLAAEAAASRTKLVLPGALLPGAWAYERGDIETAAALVLPIYASERNVDVLRRRASSHLGLANHARMLRAYSHPTDLDKVIVLGSLLAGPRYAGHPYQHAGRELVAQIEAMPPEHRKLETILRSAWEVQRQSMSVPEQLEYLASRLATTEPVDGTKTKRRNDLEALSVEWELNEMWFSFEDAAVLAPFLADDRYVPVTVLPWSRDPFQLAEPRRVSTIVAAVMNRRAEREIVRLGELRALPGDARQVRIDEIAALCREQGLKSENDRRIDVLNTPDPGPNARVDALRDLAESGDKRAIPFLLEMASADREWDLTFALQKLYELDAPEVVPEIRELLAQWDGASQEATGSTPRFLASLILLRHGDRTNLDGFDYIRTVLDADVTGYHYGLAWDEVVSLGRPEATRVLEGAIRKSRIRDDIASADSVLAYKLFMTANDEVLGMLQSRLASTATRRIRLESGWTDVPEAHYVATKLRNWGGVAAAHEWEDDPATCARQRAEVAVWLAEQHALIKAGKPNVLASTPCWICGKRLPPKKMVP